MSSARRGGVRRRRVHNPTRGHERGPGHRGGVLGNTEYTLNVDTGKLGLWPGGFFNGSAITGFGTSVNQNAGAVVPVNLTALLPGTKSDVENILVRVTAEVVEHGKLRPDVWLLDQALVRSVTEQILAAVDPEVWIKVPPRIRMPHTHAALR